MTKIGRRSDAHAGVFMRPKPERGWPPGASSRCPTSSNPENFWRISRLYYSSGRYYRALWKANAYKYPEIDKLDRSMT